jgi:hypothetical protein
MAAANFPLLNNPAALNKSFNRSLPAGQSSLPKKRFVRAIKNLLLYNVHYTSFYFLFLYELYFDYIYLSFLKSNAYNQMHFKIKLN